MSHTIYQDNLVSIDSAVVRIGSTQYDLDGIVSFSGIRKPKQACLARFICILLLLVGFVILVPVGATYYFVFQEVEKDFDSITANTLWYGHHVIITASLLFFVPAVLILFWIRLKRDTYVIQFQTSVGPVEAVSSHNEKYINQLLHALGVAKRQSKALRR